MRSPSCLSCHAPSSGRQHTHQKSSTHSPPYSKVDSDCESRVAAPVPAMPPPSRDDATHEDAPGLRRAPTGYCMRSRGRPGQCWCGVLGMLLADQDTELTHTQSQWGDPAVDPGAWKEIGGGPAYLRTCWYSETPDNNNKSFWYNIEKDPG